MADWLCYYTTEKKYTTNFSSTIPPKGGKCGQNDIIRIIQQNYLKNEVFNLIKNHPVLSLAYVIEF